MRRVKYAFFGILCILLITNATATIVILTANTTAAKIGDTVKFHIEIYPSKSVGGTFALSQETSPNYFKLVKTFFSRNSCTSCAMYNPLSEDWINDYYFIPKTKGRYFAVANFGNVTERVNFTVVSDATTTTMTTTAIPEKSCEIDSDCSCGRHKVTGECFYGNKDYVNEMQQCPDFCTGIAGNFEIRCLENECMQVQIPRTTMQITTTAVEETTTTTLFSATTTTEKGETCSTCSSYAWVKVLLILIVLIYLVYIIRYSCRKSCRKNNPAGHLPRDEKK